MMRCYGIPVEVELQQIAVHIYQQLAIPFGHFPKLWGSYFAPAFGGMELSLDQQ